MAKKGKKKVVKDPKTLDNLKNSKPISSSSTSNTRRSSRRRRHSPEVVVLEKKDEGVKRKKTENNELEANTSSHGNVDIKILTAEDYPSKVILRILEYLDPCTILSCRLVCKKWNEIATELARSRIELSFQFDDKTKIIQLLNGSKNNNNNDGRTLTDLNDCFIGSSNFPYSRFLFHLNSSKLDKDDWIGFISTFRDSINSLKLYYEDKDKSQEEILTNMKDRAKKITILLNKKFPSLEEFGINFDFSDPDDIYENISQVKLFSKSNDTDDSQDSKPEIILTKSRKFNLKTKTTPKEKVENVVFPNLKVFYIGESFLQYSGIVTDILSAAINLKKLEIQNFGKLSTNTRREKSLDAPAIIFLNSLDKLKLLQTATLRPDLPFFNLLQQGITNLLVWKLAQFTLKPSLLRGKKKLCESVAPFFTNILFSSRNTLKKLTLASTSFLTGIQFPSFPNLTRLDFVDYADYIPEAMFPSRIRHQNMFPALNKIDFPDIVETIDTLFPDDSCTPNIPSVRILNVKGKELPRIFIVKMALLCPNVETLNHCLDTGEGLEDFPSTALAIFTYMPTLKSLDMKIDVDSHDNKFPSVDVALTGFSSSTCKDLYNKLKNGGKKIKKSEINKMRKNPSILNLKDLRRLNIRLQYIGNPDDDSDDEEDEGRRIKELFKKAVTDVSKVYAFDMMNQLEFSMSSSIDKED